MKHASWVDLKGEPLGEMGMFLGAFYSLLKTPHGQYAARRAIQNSEEFIIQINNSKLSKFNTSTKRKLHSYESYFETFYAFQGWVTLTGFSQFNAPCFSEQKSYKWSSDQHSKTLSTT